MRRSRRWVDRARSFALGVLLAGAMPQAPDALGLVFCFTDDPDYHTSEPDGAWADSGWQYQGVWRGAVGTPIAPHFFLTAKHLGGEPGEPFHFAGVAYPTLAAFPDAQSDLVLWRVCGPFPHVAPLYRQTNELGAPCMLFGRGLTRGEPVRLNPDPDARVQGWRWGAYDGRLRWGLNRIAGFEETSTLPAGLLVIRFDAADCDTEAFLAGGDSGGGLFLQTPQGWALAGVHLAVDGPFNTQPADPGFPAALLDRGGLYQREEDGTWTQVRDRVADAPSAGYVTRVSSRLDWIQHILESQAGSETLPVLEEAESALGPFQGSASSVVDPAARTVRVPRPATDRFYRLDYCRPLRITTTQVEAQEVVFGYE